MRKILVFSSLLVLVGGAYAAEQEQAAAGSDQQTAAAQGAGDQGAMNQSDGMPEQSAAASSSGTLEQSGAGSQSSAQADQKQSLPYDFAASKLIGKQVSNDQGEQIGSVSDVIVDEQNQVTHAVLGVGGFLGVGERQVAIPFEELQVQGDNVVYPGGDQEQLSQMPQFQYQEEQQQAQQQTGDRPQEQQTATAPAQPGQSQ